MGALSHMISASPYTQGEILGVYHVGAISDICHLEQHFFHFSAFFQMLDDDENIFL